MLDKSFLNGVYDLHIHTGPSVANRKLDALEMMQEAEEAGYAGYLVKDHYMPSAHGCLMVQKHISKKGCKVFSSIVLNNSVGGFNLIAIDTAYNMGTRMVYMPTVSTKLHIDDHKGKKFLGSGNMTTTELETPIYIIGDDGKIIPEVIKMLEFIADKGDIVLSTGHISWPETDALLPVAMEIGVKNIIVNHPGFTVMAPLEKVVEWGRMGAYIELTACEFGMVLKDDDTLFNSIDLPNRYLDAGVPFEQMFISSDFGQSISPDPIEGLFKFINLLHDKQGFTEEQLTSMTKTIPAKIMGCQ